MNQEYQEYDSENEDSEQEMEQLNNKLYRAHRDPNVTSKEKEQKNVKKPLTEVDIRQKVAQSFRNRPTHSTKPQNRCKTKQARQNRENIKSSTSGGFW